MVAAPATIHATANVNTDAPVAVLPTSGGMTVLPIIRIH